jgi:hypothetical protein
MLHVHADPLPAPCVDCGRMIDWPERHVFNTTDGIAHLECVEARDAGAAALDDEQLERALRDGPARGAHDQALALARPTYTAALQDIGGLPGGPLPGEPLVTVR